MKNCFKKADILLPGIENTDLRKWSVVACDQFTSEPEYWEKVEKEVGDAPSTLRLILPEVYLSEAKERIPKINATMKQYLSELLVCHRDSAIYVERTQSDGSIRRGVILAIDLEQYDYNKGASSLIRATEATVIDRIPPRVAIRRDAEIELPHVMLLIDDPDKTVIEPLANDGGGLAYDTELMLGGGHIRGRFVSECGYEKLSAALNALASRESMLTRYGDGSLAPLLFAVGDGNHSLASAKAAYEEIKAQFGDKAREHPARFALAEIVNLHDDALRFEPIYRVMFGVEPKNVIAELEKYVSTLSGTAEPQVIEYIGKNIGGKLTAERPIKQLTVGTLQDFIDGYIKSHVGAEVDYIHGEGSVKALSDRDDAIGFLFEGMNKSELFKTVIFDGALPRKTFSMGHAEDKRYYLEARKIK